MKQKEDRRRLLPIDISLPETLEVAGAMFVRLTTATDLRSFWELHKSRFSFAAKGIALTNGQTFLHGSEWIFARTKAELIKAVTRWDEIGIQCIWYDWATAAASDHAGWFQDRDQYRNECLKNQTWSSQDELEYQADCLTRTPETYRGWWTLQVESQGISADDWLSGSDGIEVFDKTLTIDEVTRRMQELAYEYFYWDGHDVVVMDANEVDDEIQHLLSEKFREDG
ncbi:hypothetical protein [Pseudoduganella sp. RAF53_2]|uniref:hypothetical protein n=1 Tax=unclassified Pseudoduganella TaxID=2637179 RepID=UPI003F9519B3